MEKMLSTITNTNIDIVRTAMKVFTELNMIEILDDDTIFMTECNKMLGCETAWAEKKRLYREKQRTLSLDCPPPVRQEIEKELELDKEIEELNQYVTLLIDQRRNENAERLNWYASALLPVTILTGVFGMNKIFEDSLLKSFVLEIIVIIILSIIAYRILSKIKRR